MSQQVVPFQFHTHPVRIMPTDDGSSFWVVAKDIADILGHRDAANAVRTVPPKHRDTLLVSTPAGEQQMLCVDEPGMYRMILRSNKRQAEPFMEWVTSEVLPSIRRTGSYRQGANPEAAAANLAALDQTKALEARTEANLDAAVKALAAADRAKHSARAAERRTKEQEERLTRLQQDNLRLHARLDASHRLHLRDPLLADIAAWSPLGFPAEGLAKIHDTTAEAVTDLAAALKDAGLALDSQARARLGLPRTALVMLSTFDR